MLQVSLAMPDMHSGYGFAIGNVAAFDMDDPQAVVSPGGVGFDINCGVRLIRTNLVGSCTQPLCPDGFCPLASCVPIFGCKLHLTFSSLCQALPLWK